MLLQHVVTALPTLDAPLVTDVLMAGFLPGWLDPVNIITWLNQYGLVEIGLLAIIFAETGLLVGFFLPGDSILFTVGMFYANPATADTFTVPFWLQVILIFVTAFVGDQVGYIIGNRTGPHIFNKPDSKIFRREYVDKTYSYFERYGGRTIVLARFVPIIRTFAPVAAGVGKMHYRTFVLYNFVGALLWGVGVTCLGYSLGTISWVADNIDYIFIGIVFVSVMPIIFEISKGALGRGKKTEGEQVVTADESYEVPNFSFDNSASSDDGLGTEAIDESSIPGLNADDTSVAPYGVPSSQDETLVIPRLKAPRQPDLSPPATPDA